MSYATIDRRGWKIAEVVKAKRDLRCKGLVIDTHHPEKLPPPTLLAVYRGLTGKSDGGRPPKDPAAVVVALIEAAVPGSLGPTDIIRNICEKMRGSLRRDVIAACVAAGINEATARTQYQRWFSKNRH